MLNSKPICSMAVNSLDADRPTAAVKTLFLLNIPQNGFIFLPMSTTPGTMGPNL